MMREFIEIKTPENVTIEYELAGVGSRSLAAIVDTLIQYLVYLVLSIPLFFMNYSQIYHLLRGWKIAIAIIIVFIFNWGYYIFFEMNMNGKTPGKKIMGLRAIKENGRAVSFFDSFIRNLFRIIIDNHIGVFIMFLNKRYKRLGDITAGTIVIKERSMGKKVTLESIASLDDKQNKETAEGENTLSSDRVRINSKENEMLEDFLNRRLKLDLRVRLNLAIKLANYFLKKCELSERMWKNPEAVLEYVEREREITD